MGEKKRVGRPPNPAPAPAPRPALWESPKVAQQVDDILTALEVPMPIDVEVRRFLQRSIHRSKYFGGGGREKIILLIRTILESEGNRDALIEPIVSAVSSCMRPEWTDLGLRWIESFDRVPLVSILQTMRGLDIFSEQSIGTYLAVAIKNRLWKIFGPDEIERAKPAKAKPKPPKRRPADQPARMSA